MVAKFRNNKDSINLNVRDDLIAELDNNIGGFRDIAWRSKSKRFKDKDAKTVKYELAILITDCYWGHELKHKTDDKYYSLYYQKLKDRLGKDYRKHIDTVFDIKSGVAISSFRKRDGLTQKYKLKKEVVSICDKIYRKDVRKHSIVDRDGNRLTSWTDYAVSKTNEKGEFQKKVDNKKYSFSSRVLLNKNNGTLLTHLFSDLYKYKTGRLKLNDVKKWIEIIEKVGGNVNDGKRWTTDRLKEMHDSSMEIYKNMMVDIIGEGYVGQTYKERNKGRLYAEGFGSLQGMMREQRKILMGGLGYYEYDMVNAHYTILEQYYNLITGRKLKRIRKYIENTKVYRVRLVNETGNNYDTIKTCLISLIYGSSIKHQHRYMYGRNEPSGIYKTIAKQHSNKGLIQDCWEGFTEHEIIQDIYSEVDIAYKAIKNSCIDTGQGNGRRMKNMSNKTCAMLEDYGKGEYRTKSKGKLLYHFLQGIEAKVLLSVMNEERESFIMPHHDGWVSRMNWDTDKLEQLISQETRKMLLDYNNLKGAFDIKISKFELSDVIVGDWYDKILKKGVVDTIG